MTTVALKELAAMMELKNETEKEALKMIMDELTHRGVQIEKIALLPSIDERPLEPMNQNHNGPAYRGR